LRDAIGATRPVWVAGSTHEGEELAALEAHERVRDSAGHAVLVLVPRHPQRFDAIRSLLTSRGVRFVTRSSGASFKAEDSVLLVDTLGELLAFYAASDIAFVGGSLVPIGGHNLLEPAALGVPVIAGPHDFNAPDIAKRFIERDAIVIVNTAEELGRKVSELLADASRRQELGERVQRILEDNRGALENVLQLVRREISLE
jgi:3-deoxy-D-manno-octulosonic-acid transferase